MVRPTQYNHQLSVTGLAFQWRQLRQVEYLTDGGNSWIHTAILDGRPVVVKTLKPECQDVALAINEIESELCKYHFSCGFVTLVEATPHSFINMQRCTQD
jgi:SH3-like domain-containing protein